MSPSNDQVVAAVAGRYDVDREIGRGGMATVYLASDVKHKRKVALKVLNPELGAVLGVERFLSEISVTANLQHPNLLPLYDSGESNGLLYYVMPYVEGESLRDLLDREKQLPIDDALHIAAAIASALDYAHKHSVIHRDLKPENILLQSGEPFVADFGIALAVTNAGGNRITQTGLSLGTPQYMSPEQATGERAVDARSDIYSLGCVLYEMLAGEPPYLGGTSQAVIAKLLTERPRHVRELRDTVPEQIDWAIDRALAKIPADRFATAGEFHDVLVGRTPLARPAGTKRAAPFSIRLIRVVPWALLAAAVAWGIVKTVNPGAAPDARFYVSLPGASLVDGFTLSPDGRALAYISGVGAAKQLHVRALDQLEPRPLLGTSGAEHPTWSPSATWIAFDAGGQLLKTPRDGGPVQVVAPMGFGHDWIDDEQIVVGSGFAGTGLRLSSHAGAPLTQITRPNTGAGQMFHTLPLVLPKQKVGFIVWGAGGIEDDFLAVGDLRTGKYTVSSFVAVSTVAYVDGWLIYQDADRRLMAVHCDLGALRFDSQPTLVMENVVLGAMAPRGNGAALFLSGVRTTSVYRVPLADASKPVALIHDAGIIMGVQLAPDGRRIAYVVTRGDSSQLFVHDLRSHTSVRLRTANGLNDPVWTPDGKSLVFSEGAPRVGLWRLSADSGGEPRLITAKDFPRHPTISADGRTVLYQANVAASADQRRYEIWQASLAGDAAPRAFIANQYEKAFATLSRNGRWVAYESNETGRDEVYVRTYGGGVVRQWRISVDGGMEPRWSRDGRRLFYRWSGDVIAATLRQSPSGIDVVARQQVTHFASSSLSEWDPMFDAGTDNDLLVASANEKDWQLIFVQNWLDEFRRRVSRGR
jgi:Tol biopolymer transport system component/tRNA A-37 threonylcarbamoyl transferase component Bud32